MDHADMLLSLVTGSTDAVSRRVKDSLQATGELPHADKKTDEQLAALGFEFPQDGQVSRPRLFRAAKLPEGWKIVPTGHYMYSDLVDPQGRKRGQIGVKTSDNWSSFHLVRRFTPSYTWDDPSDRHGSVVACISDSNGREVWRGQRFLSSQSDQAREVALKKLAELAPNYNDVMAYWDEEIVWPPHETPPDTRPTFQIDVELYRGGNRSDGGPHSTCRATTVEEAKEKLLKACRSLSDSYDVKWSIFEIGTPEQPKEPRFLERGELFRPAPIRRTPRYDSYRGFCDQNERLIRDED